MNYGSPGGVIAARCDYDGGCGGEGRYVGGYNGSRGIKIGTPVPPSKNLQRQTSNPARCLATLCIQNAATNLPGREFIM